MQFGPPALSSRVTPEDDLGRSASDQGKLESMLEQNYNVNPKAFAGEHRRPFEVIRQPGGVIFEPGKCISCGICVAIAAQAKETLGLTFIGRGFDIKVGVPLNGSLAEGLQKVGAECVEHCPTGALEFESIVPHR